MTDQLRFDAIGSNGNWVQTPTLDRLAGEGVNFTNCFSNSPICMPTRISLATGHYPHNTGVWSNIHYFLPTTVKSWTQVVKSAGYHAAVFGKTHLYSHHVPDMRDHENILRACGFDEVDEIPGPRACARMMSNLTARWERKGLLDAYKADFKDRFATKPHVVRPSVLPLEEYADVYVAERAAAFLDAYDGAAPWFCWLSFGGPHEPWDTPEPYVSMYDPERMPPANMPEEDPDVRPVGQLDYLRGEKSPAFRRAKESDGKGAGRITGPYVNPLEDVPETTRFSPEFEPGDIGRMRASYAGNVTLIDEQIGKVLDIVRKRGEWENTIVVFTSDHGEMNGDYGLVYKKNFLDSAARVPLIVKTPQTPARGGVTCDGFVEWFDIGATLVDLVGGELEHRQFARSFGQCLDDPGRGHRPDALSEIVGEHMIVNSEWKLAINTEGEAYMLFDRARDPEERRNLAGRPEYRDTEDHLRLRILERVAASHVDEG